jgi:transglutaminase-like putative cysteine protease
LPAEFDLANWTIIAKQLNSNVNRWEGYVENRWYIESCDISVDESKAEMKLGLNAFASNFNSYSDAFKAFEKAYTDATNKATTSTAKTSASKSTTNAVTTGNNTTLKGGEGKYIDDIVKKVVGNETDPLKKAKLIHEHLRSKERYSYYECTRYSTPEKCYKNLSHINCADMSRLTASMMRSAGINCYVVHSTCHFYTVLNINGKLYCSDNASSSSSGRPFNYYWQGSSCHSGSTVAFRGKSSYYANCGKVPSC